MCGPKSPTCQVRIKGDVDEIGFIEGKYVEANRDNRFDRGSCNSLLRVVQPQLKSTLEMCQMLCCSYVLQKLLEIC